MASLLVLFAHPALEKSRVHRQLIASIRPMENVTIHDLYQEYPDLYIDVPREKELLLRHDIVVFQHPFHWYSAPAIVKLWIDLVLEHGWAYGTGGTALKGKRLFNALSAGGIEQAYQKEGYNRFTIREFLAPFEQTARLCNMTYLPPFVIHGTHRIDGEEIRHHAEQYRNILENLRSEKTPDEVLLRYPTLNEAFHTPTSIIT